MPTFEEQVARLRPQSSYENTDYIPSARLMQSLGNPDPQKIESATKYLQSTSGWGFLSNDEKDYFFNHYYQNGNTNKEQINKALESADISKAKDIADKTDRDRIVKELHPFINEALGKDPNEKTFSLSNPALDNGTPKDIKGLGVLNMDALAEENAEVSYDAYTVKSGDTLGKIAKANGLSLNQILAMNPDIKNPNLIKINQKINVSKNTTKSEFFRKIEEENAGPKWENRKDVKAREADLDNLQAIKGAKHSNNYVVIDKKNHTLSVFNPKGEELYKTDQISTGKSGNDYNTITYTNKNGAIINNAGNNSTPAGITEITGTADYHGVPAFTRARKGRSGEYDDEIASSFHKGLITSGGHGSNGCVRIDDNTLKVLGKYVAKGTKVYTLPEKEGSRFTLKQGKLSFTADNPYGIDEEVRNEAGRNMRFWDDYNTDVDRSYSPLKIETAKTNNHFKNENISEFINTVVDNKRAIQKEFGLTSAEYDELAHLAMGIAEQESKFGTSKKYIGKNIDDNTTIAAKRVWYNWIKGKGLSDAAIETLSRGITQIKYQGDNQELKGIYDKYGLTEQSIKKNVNDSAVATMLRLAYMYKNEILGRRFTGEAGLVVDPYDALLYKWNGKNGQLKYHTATPEKNLYIQNVRKYMDDFNTYSYMDTQYADGGLLNKFDGTSTGTQQMRQNGDIKASKVVARLTPEQWANLIRQGKANLADIHDQTTYNIVQGIVGAGGEDTVRRERDKVAPYVGAALAATFAAPALIDVAAPLVANAASKTYSAGKAILNTKYGRFAKNVADRVLTFEGVKDLVSDNGVQKTIRFAKEGRIGRAILSGTADTLNLLGGLGYIRNLNIVNGFKRDLDFARAVVSTETRVSKAYNIARPFLRAGLAPVRDFTAPVVYQAMMLNNAAQDGTYILDLFRNVSKNKTIVDNIKQLKSNYEKAMRRAKSQNLQDVYGTFLFKNSMWEPFNPSRLELSTDPVAKQIFKNSRYSNADIYKLDLDPKNSITMAKPCDKGACLIDGKVELSNVIPRRKTNWRSTPYSSPFTCTNQDIGGHGFIFNDRPDLQFIDPNSAFIDIAVRDTQHYTPNEYLKKWNSGRQDPKKAALLSILDLTGTDFNLFGKSVYQITPEYTFFPRVRSGIKALDIPTLDSSFIIPKANGGQLNLFDPGGPLDGAIKGGGD